MKTIHVPAIGELLTLAKVWKFGLLPEYRNGTLFDYLDIEMPVLKYGSKRTTIPVSLPKGSVLRVDRIYIRKGAKDFDSLTFMLVGKSTEPYEFERAVHEFAPIDPSKLFTTRNTEWDSPRQPIKTTMVKSRAPRKPVRFFASLADVNTMVVTDGETKAK